jgi:hypothetical protein
MKAFIYAMSYAVHDRSTILRSGNEKQRFSFLLSYTIMPTRPQNKLLPTSETLPQACTPGKLFSLPGLAVKLKRKVNHIIRQLRKVEQTV